ncbi:MAG: arginine--tRNA ligase [Parcubacteria group bacterium]|nr:arginine--tRNA ligase [Parcubacteria group bacterium]
MIKSLIQKVISDSYPDINFEVTTPDQKEFGHYSTNIAFVLGKKEKKNPNEIAKSIIETIKPKLEDKIEKTEVIGGYINFFLKNSYLREQLKNIFLDEKYLWNQAQIGKDKKVIIEYSSPNIAKPMHIGHLRSTIIGDALANIYEYTGFNIIRWNFIGDWGTQFGKLIVAYKKWGEQKRLEANPIPYLLELYIRFHEELKNNPSLEKEGQFEFQKLENGDPENKKLWEYFKIKSINEFNRIYEQLNIETDKMVFKGESDYESKLKSIIDNLTQRDIAKESEGALIIELPDLPPAMLRKSDGATLYLTRDLASLEDRVEKKQTKKILYVVANQQALHFEQLFAVAKLLKIDAELVHVKFGMVLGEDGKKLATREGRVVLLQEVINKIEDLAIKTVKEKNPQLDESRSNEVAHAVAIGALKYNDLKQHPYSDITFDWKAMLNLGGNSGPYIQYTFARLNNILEKGGQGETSHLELLTDEQELNLISELLNFPEIIKQCVQLNTANSLALYLYHLASKANHFYETIRILDDQETARKMARLVLIKSVAQILEQGLNLLGIKALKRI